MVALKNKKNNLKKKDIIKNIFDQTGISSLYSKRILNDTIEILINSLILERIIKIKNFGTFTLQHKDKRIGRNPKNKETHVISERIVALFAASNNLKIKINNA